MNVVDSCGWLEYIADGPNASFFEPVLADLPKLVVPAITIYEVCKRILLQRDQADAIIWQTAQAHGAQLFTQDADLKNAPGVQYRVKG